MYMYINLKTDENKEMNRNRIFVHVLLIYEEPECVQPEFISVYKVFSRKLSLANCIVKKKQCYNNANGQNFKEFEASIKTTNIILTNST